MPSEMSPSLSLPLYTHLHTEGERHTHTRTQRSFDKLCCQLKLSSLLSAAIYTTMFGYEKCWEIWLLFKILSARFSLYIVCIQVLYYIF